MENLITHADSATHAAIMVAIGLLIRFVIGYRRFNRRGVGGLQHFESYWKAVFFTLLEWLLKWVANAIILFGIITIIISI